MRVIRKQSVQAHAVPGQAYQPGLSPASLFDPAVMRKATPVVEEVPPEYPQGASVANGMAGVAMYRCNRCESVVAEPELESHRC